MRGLSAHGQQIFAGSFIVGNITGNGIGKGRFSIGDICKQCVKRFCIYGSFLTETKRFHSRFDGSIRLRERRELLTLKALDTGYGNITLRRQCGNRQHDGQH